MKGTLRGAGAALVSVALVVGVAGCGDDGDDGGAAATTTQAPSGDTTAFCDALVQFNTAVNGVDLDETSSKEDVVAAGQQLGPLFDKVVDNAPGDLVDQARELDATLAPMLQGDASQFAADATFAKYGQLLDGAIDECAMATVAVTGVDYAFEGAPDTVQAGTVAFRFTNKSAKEDHELVILKKADGTTESWSDLLQLPEDQASAKTVPVARTQASPGESSATLADLTPGSYAMLCFLPVGGAEGGEPHFMQGMVHEFTVE